MTTTVLQRAGILKANAMIELDAALNLRRHRNRAAEVAAATARAARMRREAEALERRATRAARRCGHEPAPAPEAVT